MKIKEKRKKNSLEGEIERRKRGIRKQFKIRKRNFKRRKWEKRKEEGRPIYIYNFKKLNHSEGEKKEIYFGRRNWKNIEKKKTKVKIDSEEKEKFGRINSRNKFF